MSEEFHPVLWNSFISNLHHNQNNLKPTRISSFVFLTLIWIGSLFGNHTSFAGAGNTWQDTGFSSSQQDAIILVDKIKSLNTSAHWPHIKPDLFLANLKLTIYKPLSIYPGRMTNFCGYGALTYLVLQEDPVQYVKFMLELYNKGTAHFNSVFFEPSPSVRDAGGKLIYKGKLDIYPAEQMLFLTLADHFKGYLNILDHHYNPGDEDSFWASVNFAKFNKMVKKMLNYKVQAVGSDLFHPGVKDLYEYISKRLGTGSVVLYLNNRLLHKKNLVTLKLGIPTHFVVLQQIRKEENLITLVYWDYGGRTLLQLSPSFLKKIIFGISYFTKQSVHE